MMQGPEQTLSGASLQAIFDCLLDEPGIDFSSYKPSTMSRRILRRMAMAGLKQVDDYVQTLRLSAQERHALVRDLLVRVTQFFRDIDAFAWLEHEVIPDLMQSAPERQPIRVWVPACSTGEEAYSIAMLFREALDRVPSQADVRILATDVDRHAIEVAAQGLYPESIAETVTPQRLQRFFGKEQDRYRVNRHLREMLSFAPHNLLDGLPFTKVSLVSCRNCLIYLDTVVQQRILACFAYALRQQGYLWLGPSEACGSLSSVFRTVHAKWKIYQKVSTVESFFDTQHHNARRGYDPEQELAYIKGYLRATIVELEANLEQLQLTNDALAAAREELQSTKEELQSVHEELYMVTVECEKKIQVLSKLNHDIDNLMRSAHAP